jgi:putative ATPase
MAIHQILFTYTTPDGRKLHVVEGDITAEPVDAIVNAANEHLAHGGGVAGAIVRRGGYAIQAESDAWVQQHGPVRSGTAAITSGGDLPARYVIHAVGPVWRNRGDEPELLRLAVQCALALADAQGLQSISIPAISSGIFGFPKPLAAQVIWGAVLDYFAAHLTSSLQEVRFCNIDQPTARLFYEEGLRRKDEQARER